MIRITVITLSGFLLEHNNSPKCNQITGKKILQWWFVSETLLQFLIFRHIAVIRIENRV
jgi:hypothetical protein